MYGVDLSADRRRVETGTHRRIREVVLGYGQICAGEDILDDDEGLRCGAAVLNLKFSHLS